MIDIETMSTKSNALILAVSLVDFSDRIESKKTWYLDTISQILDRDIDPETKQWWKQRSFTFYYVSKGTDKLVDVLTELSFYLNMFPEKNIWAKDPDFDCRILENAFQQFQIKCPWSFRDKKSVRTIEYLLKIKNIKLDDPENPHDPESDAVAQAKNVIKVFS